MSRPVPHTPASAQPACVYGFTARDAMGEERDLGSYRGQALLIVNVASRCGFTPQYAGLEHLYRQYQNQGFTILAFPCNQFGAQEPEPDSAIQSFCRTTYDISFPVLAKIDVNGPDAHPLFQWLVSAAPGWFGSRAIKWNFTKFLIDRHGRPLGRYAPRTAPRALESPIKRALAAR